MLTSDLGRSWEGDLGLLEGEGMGTERFEGLGVSRSTATNYGLATDFAGSGNSNKRVRYTLWKTSMRSF